MLVIGDELGPRWAMMMSPRLDIYWCASETSKAKAKVKHLASWYAARQNVFDNQKRVVVILEHGTVLAWQQSHFTGTTTRIAYRTLPVQMAILIFWWLLIFKNTLPHICVVCGAKADTHEA